MTSYSVSPAMQRKAEALAELLHTFPRGRSNVDGSGFYIVPGTRPLTAHWSNVFGCTCEGHRRRGVCTHQFACQVLQQRADAALSAQHTSRARASYADLFPADEEPARVTIARPCAVGGCPVEAGTDSSRCPHHARQQWTVVAA